MNMPGVLRHYLQKKYVNQERKMTQNGWDPKGSTLASLEWWGKQNSNRTVYGTVILVTEHRKLIKKCDTMQNQLQTRDKELSELKKRVEELNEKCNSSDQSTTLACIPGGLKDVQRLYPDLSKERSITDPLYFENKYSGYVAPMAPMVTKI